MHFCILFDCFRQVLLSYETPKELNTTFERKEENVTRREHRNLAISKLRTCMW